MDVLKRQLKVRWSGGGFVFKSFHDHIRTVGYLYDPNGEVISTHFSAREVGRAEKALALLFEQFPEQMSALPLVFWGFFSSCCASRNYSSATLLQEVMAYAPKSDTGGKLQ